MSWHVNVFFNHSHSIKLHVYLPTISFSKFRKTIQENEIFLKPLLNGFQSHFIKNSVPNKVTAAFINGNIWSLLSHPYQKKKDITVSLNSDSECLILVRKMLQPPSNWLIKWDIIDPTVSGQSTISPGLMDIEFVQDSMLLPSIFSNVH